MELIKKLKRKSVLKSLGWLVLAGFFGLVFLSAGEVGLLFQEPRDLFDVPESELEGAYVTFEVDFIYGSYAYKEEYRDNKPTGIITEQEYIIDANVDDYMGLLLKRGDYEQADQLMEQCFAYADGLGSEPTATFTVTGVIKPMSSSSLRFYHETIGYGNMSAEEQALFLPLCLDTSAGPNAVMVVIGAVCIAIGLFVVIWAGSGKKQAQLQKKATQLGNAETVLTWADRLYQEVKPVHGLRIGYDLVLLEIGAKQYLHSAQEICWAYKQTTQQRLYGIIPLGKTFALRIRTLDGGDYSVAMNEKQVEEMLQRLHQELPNCLVGYSQELESLYGSNPQQFVQMGAYQHNQQL